MFSSGELIVIGLVALIVIGPERLPKVARTAGHLLGRLQRYVSDVKADIDREMRLEEVRKIQQQVADEVRSVGQAVGGEVKSMDEHLKAVETSLNESIVQAAAEKPVAPAAPLPAAPSAPPPDAAADKPKS